MTRPPPSSSVADFITLDPTEDRRWHDFVIERPDARIFHHPAWLGLLRDQYRFPVRALCLVSGTGISAGLPFCELASALGRKRWLSLPFSDRCGPVADSPDAAGRLLAEHLARARRASVGVEIRDATEDGADRTTLATHWHHTASLERSNDELLMALDPDARRLLRKAQKAGVVNEVRRDPQALEIFYRLHLETRRKQGVPIQPRRYFELFQRRIIEAGLGFVSLARHGSRHLSAGVICTFNGTALYKYAASDPGGLRHSPNHVMLWESMIHAGRLGARCFDFGKTAHDNAGLRAFKMKWAAEESDLPYTYSPTAPSPSWRDALATTVVKPLIRRSPRFVCRAAGELLYRRFAT